MAPGVTGGNGIALRVEDLSIAYALPRLARRLDAVSRVSFDVAAGSFVSLVGPSGCGKTSILNTVAGLLPGFEGHGKTNRLLSLSSGDGSGGIHAS